MTSKRKCTGKVADRELRGIIFSCQRPATVQRDGQWWCWQHDPERVRAEEKKRRAGWEAEMDREAAKYKRIARNARLGALVTEETAALLERLAILAESAPSICCGLADICHGCSIRSAISQCELDEKAAIALAASIREALEVNDETR